MFLTKFLLYFSKIQCYEVPVIGGCHGKQEPVAASLLGTSVCGHPGGGFSRGMQGCRGPSAQEGTDGSVRGHVPWHGARHPLHTSTDALTCCGLQFCTPLTGRCVFFLLFVIGITEPARILAQYENSPIHFYLLSSILSPFLFSVWPQNPV